MRVKKFSEYTARENGKRALAEATDEVRREIDVRRRIYDRWVSEGKVSYTEAHDRLERMLSALSTLVSIKVAREQATLDTAEGEVVDVHHLHDVGPAHEEVLDTVPAEQA